VVHRASWVHLAVALFVLLARAEAAVPPAETLLPNSTKGFLSVASMSQLQENWNKTQLGQLMQDQAMKPFVEDLKRQIQDQWTKTHQKLGITWDDLEGVPAGEVSMALVQPSATEVAVVIMADVTGHEAQTNALLEKINQNLAAQKAVRSQRTISGVAVTLFDVPKHEDTPARQVVYVVKDDLLAATDSLKVMQEIVARQAQPKADALADLPAYTAIMNRCKNAAGDLQPHARWFIEPFGYAEALRVSSHQPRKKGTDMLKIFKQQGFTAIQGVGGFVNFYTGDYEILHRTHIYAPGNQGGGERFTLAARMLDFPTGGNFLPPDWVPRDVASYASLNINVKNAFESSKTLVNDVVGDEVFEDVLDSIKTDENGPKIDIRKDVIAFLGNRVTIISDLQLPITPKSERMLYAVQTIDEQHLAKVIKNWMETDPDTRRRDIAGHVVWEIVDEKAELPMITIEGSPILAGADPAEEEEEKEERALPANSAVTVAHGHLFIASHIDILTKILTDVDQREKLATSADYLRVAEQISKLNGSQEFVQTFTRTDDAYRGTYELLRSGKMPEAESMMGRLLNSLLGEGKEGVLRSQRIDGTKLPEYDMVRRYLGPAGLTGLTEQDGWFLTGFTLIKDAQ